MATEDKINNEEQLQEDATVNQTEETQEQAESTNEEGAETPAVEIDPLEAAQAEIAELKKQILYKVFL